MYYEDYDYSISEEDLKTDFHIALDKIIDAEVEKRLKECVADIDYLREQQKQYDEKIAEANRKVKDAENKQHEAEMACNRAKWDVEKVTKQCEQSISDATKAKLDELFGDWLKERYVYYVVKETSWLTCPYCHSGDVQITLPNGDKATTKCKVCGGQGHTDYYLYTTQSVETNYPTFKKDGNTITPGFLRHEMYGGMRVITLDNIMTRKDAEAKAKERTEESKQKAMTWFEERKKKLDEGEAL